jgi:hypothetical protein
MGLIKPLPKAKGASYRPFNIGFNPIREQDTDLRILAEKGILCYCQTRDGKRHYLISEIPYKLTFHIHTENTPKDRELLIRYIAKAGKPGRYNNGSVYYPFPSDVVEAGNMAWISCQTSGRVPEGDLIIKSTRDGEITFLMSLSEQQALRIWCRNPGRIASLEDGLAYLGKINGNMNRMYGNRTRRVGTSPKEVKKRIRQAKIADEMKAQEYEQAAAKVDKI